MMKKNSIFKNTALLGGLLISAAALAVLPGCGDGEKTVAAEKKGPQMFPAGVMKLELASRTLKEELPGRVDAVRMAEVRARATGILLERKFVEGDSVKKGQELFRIDPAELEATLDSARASLASAKTSLESAEIIFKRMSELAPVGGVSQQEYDNARIAVASAKAGVLGNEAAVKNAEIALGYATVVSPIDGVIGEAFETEGALVSAAQATKLATVRQMDPVYFDFSQSGKKQLELRRAVKEGRAELLGGDVKVVLLLEDGTEYAHAGTLKFSDISVDATTGMFKLRAEFPNPEHTLLPGMFARAVLVEGVDKHSILVPQKAVTRGTAGKATIFKLDKDDFVRVQPIEAKEMDENGNWVVTGGLEAGDRIVTDGIIQIGMMLPAGPVKIIPQDPNGPTVMPGAAEKPADAKPAAKEPEVE